jgi:large subunit ribosomal protein L19e
MQLTVQRRLAGDLLDCSQKRVSFDQSRLNDIKEAITKADIKALIREKAINEVPVKGISRLRAKIRHTQRVKGRQRGHGKRKGRKNAREESKRKWINKVRAQRKFLQELKINKSVDSKIYRSLYLKSKGGFFRSKRHIKLYITEHKLVKKNE